MTDLDWLPAEPDATRPEREPRKCRRHVWGLRPSVEGGWLRGCIHCSAVRNEVTSRRGRNARARGNDAERWVNRLLGIEGRGPLGLPEDGGNSSDWIRVQTKSGAVYPARFEALLDAMTTNADQLRAVAYVSTPGAGHRRRGLIVLDIEDFAAWYGK